MSRIPRGSAGNVYIITSPSLIGSAGSPLLKIGATMDSPLIRAEQLSASTSAATKFHVAYYRRVNDCTAVEAEMHRQLDSCRVNSGREFFDTPLWSAMLLLDRLAGDKQSYGPATPMAELFASFRDSDDPYLNEDEQRQCRELEARL